jgi:hypothetical protein
MNRFTYPFFTGKSTRYHPIEFVVTVDDFGKITFAMRLDDGRLRAGLTNGEAMELAAILQAAARVAG